MSIAATRAELAELYAFNLHQSFPYEPRRGYPFTVGLPMARGVCREAERLTLSTPDGRTLPTQVRTLDRWSDGSIRWALIDVQADVQTAGALAARLSIADAPVTAPAMPVTRTGETITIDTGACLVAAASRPPFVTVQSRDAADASLEFEVVTANGNRCVMREGRVALEEAGALRSVLRISGLLAHSSHELLEASLRIHVFAGLGAIRCDVQLRNPRAARHRGGHWDLGDPASVYIRSASLSWRRSAAPAGTLWCSPEAGRPPQDVDAPFAIEQDSSGGENWRSTNHVNRHREIPLRFRGYRLTQGGRAVSGDRATPIVGIGTGADALAVAAEYFWQNFPKAIESDGREIVFHLFPQTADVHEIQGGEQKTHTVHFLAGPDPITRLPLDWARLPQLLCADPAYYAATGAVPYLTPERDDPHREYVRLVRSAIEGPDSFERKREIVDEYGWRHFGDIYGDHEAVFHKGPGPLVSHYNNQYDAIAGFAFQFMRSGEAAWWRQMRELAWHVADIDIYHTDRDKSAYNRGLFWHTIHHFDADTATHRTYPKSCGHGGGPANEQNYTTGLMLAWFLTGEAPFREAALDLAHYPIRVDDGNLTVFRWLARGDTGLATCSGSALYHGPGRGAGNSLNALLDGHRLTGDRRYMEKAEQIIRRVVHPNADIAAQNLLDVERKWFYTMFLQALGRYLDSKEELGEIDRMYAWAQASLLHYARWMAEHEYPYLDKPEILQFPTETWSAQDLRKCDVFHHAAFHTNDPAERERFRERAAFFFRDAVARLSAFPTRHYARPVVILLSTGWKHAWCLANPGHRAAPAPEIPEGFGAPYRFVRPRARAVRRARGLAAAGALLVVAAALRVLL